MAVVCVFCGSSGTIAERYLELAADVGTAIGRRGHGLVTGGATVSMMGAVSRSARAAGAHTTGVMPKLLMHREIGDADNDEYLVVDTMRERKAAMDLRADGFLTLPGGLGTFEELFEIWTAKTIGIHAKPVVVLDPWHDFDPLWAALESLRDKGFIRQGALETLTVTRDLEAALDAVIPPD
jgi:uncharacterized protein (TIGR00730 family)